MPKNDLLPSVPSVSENEENQLDSSLWPDLTDGKTRLNCARTIYHRGGFSSQEVEWLRGRGYDPIDIITLPRTTDDEQQKYLLAKAQGIEEGTIPATAEDRRQLALNMHAFGLLKSKDMSFDIRTTSGQGDVDSILDWTKSRHTFKDNSTVDIAGRTPEELREQTHRAVDEARARAEAKVKELKGGKKTRRANSPAKKKITRRKKNG